MRSPRNWSKHARVFETSGKPKSGWTNSSAPRAGMTVAVESALISKFVAKRKGNRSSPSLTPTMLYRQPQVKNPSTRMQLKTCPAGQNG